MALDVWVAHLASLGPYRDLKCLVAAGHSINKLKDASHVLHYQLSGKLISHRCYI